MTPHQLVKGTGHSDPLELHPEQLTKPKGPVMDSEVNDSRPVGSGHWALKGPSDCVRDSNWKFPLILCLSTLFFLLLLLLLLLLFS